MYTPPPPPPIDDPTKNGDEDPVQSEEEDHSPNVDPAKNGDEDAVRFLFLKEEDLPQSFESFRPLLGQLERALQTAAIEIGVNESQFQSLSEGIQGTLKNLEIEMGKVEEERARYRDKKKVVENDLAKVIQKEKEAKAALVTDMET